MLLQAPDGRSLRDSLACERDTRVSGFVVLGRGARSSLGLLAARPTRLIAFAAECLALEQIRAKYSADFADCFFFKTQLLFCVAAHLRSIIDRPFLPVRHS